MFKFLKEKLKSAISRISEGVKEEGKIEENIAENPAEEVKEEKESKGFFAKLREKIAGKEIIEEKKPVIEEKKSEIKEDIKPRIEIKKEDLSIEKELEIAEDYARDGPNEWPESRIVYCIEKAETRAREKGIDISQRINEIRKIWNSHKTQKQKMQYPKSEPPKHKEERSKIKKSEEKAEIKHEVKEPIKPVIEEASKDIIYKEPEKKGFFKSIKEKIITTKINEEQFDKLFWDLELALMENNVAVEVIEKIKNDLKEQLVDKPIKRTQVENTISLTLKNSIGDLFEISSIDLIRKIKNKKEKPYIIAFFGINGSGKTTSIAKLANLMKEKGISCVLAAGDTFRAASIEQLQQHADNIGIKLVKHDYGSDPAAVAFDAIKHAKAKSIDVVLIDTAGRMHSNQNLLDEMKKIIRVAKPDLKIFVGESITGNDCVEQAKTFNEAVGIDGIILAKADIDEKGGAAVSVSYVTKKPILYLGTGQRYSDLQEFDAEIIMKNLGLTQ